ncbi:MAG TPA: LpqB family beta-propeller domain-containing protein [Devosia sp.]|nr:LpqB family beta-propeller domain-containing protein [Devosia sp.]
MFAKNIPAYPGTTVMFQAGDDVRAALASVGRTEDLKFSPDGRRLAIAGFSTDSILVLEVAFDPDGRGPVVLSAPLVLRSASFRRPHGMSWIDGETMIVANRKGEAPIIRVPTDGVVRELHVEPLHTIRCDPTDLLDFPGSVSVFACGDDIYEVLICNNSSDEVSRHLLDGRDGFAPISSDVVVTKRLSIPDGVAHSHSGAWVAVSNHNDSTVLLYRAELLGRSDEAAGVLQGIGYPHGLHFSTDDRSLLVADAGAPLVHVFTLPEGGDWTGERHPAARIEAIDADTFQRGHVNEQEGGPKGIDLSPDGTLLVLTCEEQPLAFLDMRPILGRHAPVAPIDRSRALMAMRLGAARLELGELRRLAIANGQLGGRKSAEARAADAEARAAVAETRAAALVASSSWRLTAPLRKVVALLRR